MLFKLHIIILTIKREKIVKGVVFMLSKLHIMILIIEGKTKL